MFLKLCEQILVADSKYEDSHFEKVDLYFAKSLIPDPNLDDSRLFLAYLFAMAREGHICCEVSQNRIFPEPSLEIKDRIILGAESVPSDLVTSEGPLVKVNNLWYLHRNFTCEKKFLEALHRFKAVTCENYSEEMLEGKILTLEQKQAIIKALNSSLCVVGGGPGTGKTRTAIELISLFLKDPRKTAAVCAPTGKATANLRPHLELFKERCTISTLHSLLQRSYHPYDLVIVDEGSMIDAFLMQKLFSVLKQDAKLVIFGDIDQLPPVGSGNFFKDLIVNNLCEKAFLTKCLRAELQEIVDLARKVKDRETLISCELPSHKELLGKIRYEGTLEDMFAHYRSLRILTPQRKGPYGVDTLNQLFYRHAKAKFQQAFIPIIIKVNDVERGLYNGDFGLLDEENKVAYFENDKRILSSILPNYEYGFVLSVHKSQGSEYEEVMVLLPEGAECFGKEMLYTAVTRARKKVTLYGDHSILAKITSREAHRFSGISHGAKT